MDAGPRRRGAAAADPPSTSTSPRRWQVVVRLQVVVTDDPPTPRGQLSSGMAAQEVVRLKSFLLRAVEVFTIIPYNLLKCCHVRVRSQTSPPVSRLQARLLLYDHSGPFFQLFACGAPQDTGILLFLRSVRTFRTRWALTLLACMTRQRSILVPYHPLCTVAHPRRLPRC